MHEIKCPHCGEAFTVDEAGYAAILSQVRTKEFESELHKQLEVIAENEKKKNELELSKASALKDKEINELRMKIQQLEADISHSESKTELEIANAVSAEKQRSEDKLRENELEIAEKKEQILQLNSAIDKLRLESRLELKEAVSQIEKERDTQKAEYEAKLKAQQDTLEYYKDLKTKMSTKMIGETLEQHCENSFNMIRTAAFRNAEFGKDNDAKDGSKGDYIYREKDDSGNEIISIMFEMKNEMDTTATKHKNQDFFAKLDRDRNAKNCEYAVLVSLLEADNEMYNQGIVDVSYEYEKMYVIRPQFFIPMITILRNAAMNSLEYKQKLSEIKNQEIDISRFEERIEDFKTAFSKNYNLAGTQFNNAIAEIDKTIDHLNKVKDNLLKSVNNLRLANDKAQKQLTIKALAKGNDTMLEMFAELAENDE